MDAFTESLVEVLGTNRVLHKVVDIIPYGFDGTAAIKHCPRAVVFPRSAIEVSTLVKLARENRVPIVTRGSGTGLSGGSVPVPGGLVICLVEMNRILEIDSKNLVMRAESGVVTQRIYEAADSAGLFYPPDPGSMKVSTIGGNVSENAGGLRGLKYGVTRDYVIGLEVVLADGSICWLGNKCVKDVAGYNLRDLFIGSEGTLGIITQVLLSLVPKPARRATIIATFQSMERASDVVSSIIANKIIPCTLEFLDRKTIQCVEAFSKVGLPIDAEAMLLIEADGHPASVSDEMNQIDSLCRSGGASMTQRAKDSEEATKLCTARRSAFSALARLKPTTILEDVTVPRSELAKMVSYIRKVAEQNQLEIATFGHFGDGNLHPTILTDERNQDEMHRVETAMSEIVGYALGLGGTITGEHGVGLAKKKYLRQQLGDDSYRFLKLIKTAIDPNGLLNPGKIFE